MNCQPRPYCLNIRQESGSNTGTWSDWTPSVLVCWTLTTESFHRSSIQTGNLTRSAHLSHLKKDWMSFKTGLKWSIVDFLSIRLQLSKKCLRSSWISQPEESQVYLRLTNPASKSKVQRLQRELPTKRSAFTKKELPIKTTESTSVHNTRVRNSLMLLCQTTLKKEPRIFTSFQSWGSSTEISTCRLLVRSWRLRANSKGKVLSNVNLT